MDFKWVLVFLFSYVFFFYEFSSGWFSFWTEGGVVFIFIFFFIYVYLFSEVIFFLRHALTLNMGISLPVRIRTLVRHIVWFGGVYVGVARYILFWLLESGAGIWFISVDWVFFFFSGVWFWFVIEIVWVFWVMDKECRIWDVALFD